MQLGGELLCLDSYLAPPAGIQASPREDPVFSAYMVPPRKEAYQCLVSPREESDHIW